MENFDQFEFTGLSAFLQKLAHCMQDVAYLAVCDYKTRNQYSRIDLDAEVLTTWLRRNLPAADTAEPFPELYDPDAILSAVELWIKKISISSLRASMRREYMLQAVGPKGGIRLINSKMVVKGLECDDDAEAEPPSQASPKVPMPRPDLSAADSTEISKNYRNVGEQYTAVTNLALGTANELMAMHKEQMRVHAEANAQLRQENGELRQENRAMLHRLEEIVQSQRDQTQASHDQVIELARLQVANNAVGQVTSTVQSFMAMKAGAGLPTPLQALLAAMSQNPALMAAIQEPDVQALLQDQQILSGLATQLREFASMKKLAAQSATPSA